ncbi:hypothetical protein JCM6882_000820 [Rhodosporidiobolus microsporus]
MSAVLAQLPDLPSLIEPASTINGKPIRLKPRVALGDLTPNNLGTVRKLHACLFPVSYSPKFFADLLDKHVTPEEYNKLVFYQDLPVGVLVCRLEREGQEGEGEGKEGGEGPWKLYVMTLGVLAPYRRQGLASKLIHHLLTSASSTHSQPSPPAPSSASPASAPAPAPTPAPTATSSSAKKGKKSSAPPPQPAADKKPSPADKDEKKASDEDEPEPLKPVIESIYLHVQVGNDDARRFWEKWGFEVKDTVKDYYRKLEPRDAWLLERKVGPVAGVAAA